LFQQVGNKIEIKQFADKKIILNEEIDGTVEWGERICYQNESGVWKIEFDVIEEMKRNARL
jgi:hypothetical protein